MRTLRPSFVLTLVLPLAIACSGPSEKEQQAACATGIVTETPRGGECGHFESGRCFGQDTESACLCAGCNLDRCQILESSPSLVVCD